MRKVITLGDAQNLFKSGRLQMRVNKHGRIECVVGSTVVKVTRDKHRALYNARSLRMNGK